MAYKLITAPAAEPVSTAEAKTHLRITHSDDDTYIGTLISAARLYAEAQTRRALINQTWELTAESFPKEIRLIPAPLSSVTHIKYYDGDGTLQTLSSSAYQVDTTDSVGIVTEAYGYSWPTVRDGLYNGVQVRFVAGYGGASTDVPSSVIHAIKILVSHWYEAREPIIVGASVSNVPMSADALLGMHATPEIF